MYDILIIGGGMAAYSAALFAGRRGLKVLVLAKDIGGQANSTDVIENFPAVPPIGGYELVTKIKKQAEAWGVETEITEVQRLRPVTDGDGFVVHGFGKQYKARAAILAFGKTPMDLNVPGEAELKGKGVSYCATCDAPLYKGREVIVAGYGDFGLEAALLCAKYAKKVYTLSKTDKLIGHPGLAKKVLKHKKIKLVPHVQIQEICGKDYLEYIKCHNLITGEQFKIPAQGLFVEIGYVVNSRWLEDVVDLDDEGQVIIGPDQSTTLEGVFAAGDATNRPYKQAVISAGEGAAAALAAHDWLMRQRGSTGLSSDWTEIRIVK
jgi:thioredoxin reductase (NADPH)